MKNTSGLFNIFSDKGTQLLSKINTAKTFEDKKDEYEKILGFVPKLPGETVEPEFNRDAYRLQLRKFLDGASYDFKYEYDKNKGRDRNLFNSSTIEIGEFYSTDNNHEDPIIYGYKLMIDYDSSPLFNGAVNEFLQRYRFYNEFKDIDRIYNDFILRFKEFFSSRTGSDEDTYGKKRHYIRNIAGLNSLSESNLPKKYKSITKYRDDILTISFTDDVRQSFNELATLYKLLSWNKFSAKLVIPENLLRFNMYITVCDVRKFNRYYTTISSNLSETDIPGTETPVGTNSFAIDTKTNDGELISLLDNLTKVKYVVNECQFFFDNLSHGDNINLGSVKPVEDTTITISYKFSNYFLEKPTFNLYKQKFEVITYGQQSPKTFTRVSNSLSNIKPYTENWNIITYGVDIRDNANGEESTIDDLKRNNKNMYWNKLLGDVKKAGEDALGGFATAMRNEAQRQVNKRLKLINDAINNTRESIGLGQIGEPRNVYQGTSLFENEIRNVGRKFFGDVAKSAIRGL